MLDDLVGRAYAFQRHILWLLELPSAFVLLFLSLFTPQFIVSYYETVLSYSGMSGNIHCLLSNV
jgi:hypothetical protein